MSNKFVRAIRCPHCDAQLSYKPEFIGGRGSRFQIPSMPTCPGCGRSYTIGLDLEKMSIVFEQQACLGELRIDEIIR